MTRNFVIPRTATLCDECKRQECKVAFIEDGQNHFCLKCASDLYIITEDQLNAIIEYGELQGGSIEKAIQRSI